MQKKLTFSEFLKKVFPFETPFDREEYGLVTNTIKFLALRMSFIFYRLGITANGVDIIAILLTIPGFVLAYKGISNQELDVFLLSYAILAFVIFIDFIDGPISKTHKYKFKIGDDLDNLSPDIVLMGGFVLIGFMTENIFLITLNCVNAVFLITYKVSTITYVPKDKEWLFSFLSSRFSLLSVRVFTGTIFPLLSIIYIISPSLGANLATALVLTYFILSALWMKATFEDKEIR